MSTETPEKPVTRYAGFRKPRTVGLADTSLPASLAWLADLFLVIVTMTYLPWWGKALMVTQLILLLGLVVVKNADGVSVWTRVMRRLRYLGYAKTGMTAYQSTLVGPRPLTGVMSEVQALEYQDGLGERFVLLHYPYSQQYAAVFITEPDGGERHDRRHRDQRVANWGAFGASLGNIPTAAQFTVATESAPRTNAETRAKMEQYIREGTSETAQDGTRERLNMGVDNHAANTTWVTVTFNATDKGNSAKARQANALHIAQLIPGLVERLNLSGAGPTRPATERDLAEYMRAALDPPSRPVIEDAHAHDEDTGLTWANCGPGAMVPTWDYLMHNQAISQTLLMSAPPAGAITDEVLKHLLQPHADVHIKRVTLIQQVIETGRAAVLTNRDLGNAELRAETQRRSGAARLDARLAQRSSDEHAEGHGLVDLTLAVTVTVEDPLDLRRAVAVVRTHLGNAANIRFQPALNQQDTAFYLACPTGFDPWAHSTSESVSRAATTAH